MPFDNIFGQDKAVNFLVKSIVAGNLAHAYLFTGPAGVGKRTTALTLAQVVNCQEGFGRRCGVCSQCRRIKQGIHPDVKEVEPEGKNIKIAQIRALQKDVYYRPLEGRYKVYVMAAADKMTVAAANSFLKILEEPPSYALFILGTIDSSHLLPTVVSRCQVVTFYHLPLALLRERLQVEMGLEQKRAEMIAAGAGGSWGRAQEMATSNTAETLRSRVLEITRVFSQGDLVQRWQLAAELEKEADQNLILEQILYWYRDLLVLKETGDKKLVINKDQAHTLQMFAAKYSRSRLLAALAAIQETRKILTENTNTRLALDVLVGKLEPDNSP